MAVTNLQVKYIAKRAERVQLLVINHQDFCCPCVCASVRDGCGRGFSVKLFILRLQRAARYVRHATVGACHRTSNRQEHKIIQRARPEQDTIFHLHVTACRRRGSHGHDERLAWVASRGQRTSCSSSFVSKVLGANYKRANNFLPVAHKIHHVH